jgi:predicted molibdopterin-dependent oxidoreductase YjgC
VRSDWEAICAVSTAMGTPFVYRDPSEIMDEVTRLTPSLAGINYARLDETGLQWPVPETNHPGTPILHRNAFPRGRARFAAVENLPPEDEPSDAYPLVLITGRVLEHYNSGTMTRRTQLVDVVDHDYLEVHPDDARAWGLVDGGRATVTSRRGSACLTVRVSERVAHGIMFTSFHFPEDSVNALTSSSSDLLTRCPEYKVLAVRVEPLPVAGPAAGHAAGPAAGGDAQSRR